MYVRLPKFGKSLSECESLLDKLLFSLRHAHEFDEKPEQLCGALFEKIFLAAKIANFTAKEHSEYRAGLMNKWDYGASMKFAREEGVAEGIAVGEAKGLLQAARQMKAEGFDAALISRMTSLSEDEIEHL